VYNIAQEDYPDMSDENTLLQQWTELKEICDGLEHDVAKNARGVAAAGIRIRKSLRELQKKARAFVKFTITRDKELKAAKPKKPGRRPPVGKKAPADKK
jgi:hypothetical protein